MYALQRRQRNNESAVAPRESPNQPVAPADERPLSNRFSAVRYQLVVDSYWADLCPLQTAWAP